MFSLTCTKASSVMKGATLTFRSRAAALEACRTDSVVNTVRLVSPCERAFTIEVKKLPSSSRATF